MKPESSQPNNSNLKDSVLGRLATEEVAPTSKLWFWCLDCVMWGLWVVTVLLGAIAAAVALCLSIINSVAFREATHDTAWEFWLEAIPFIWIIFFILTAAVAYRQFRRTRRGYRHHIAKILGGSVVISMLLGFVLHEVGVGYIIDQKLGEHMPLYDSQEEKELQLWQAPEDGRLVGRFAIESARFVEGGVVFADIDNVTWELNTGALRPADLETLQSLEQVKILGMMATSSDRLFYACGVFPWMYDMNMDYSELGAERVAFMERMYAHKDEADRLSAIDTEVYNDTRDGLCARMPVIPRISESMQ